MSARARKILVGVLLAAYFVWPLVHHQLVLRYRIDPWKLAGWAMYTTSAARIRISLSGVDESGRPVRVRPRSTARLQTILSDYVYRRRTLGLFAPPDSVVREVADMHPDYAEWTVTVDEIGLNAENYFAVIHRSTYRYPNIDGAPGPAEISYPTAKLTRADRKR